MKNNRLVIIGSIALILLCIFAGYYNNSAVISKEKAEQIATDYIKTKKLDLEGKAILSEVYLTSDFHSMVFRRRQWIIEVDEQKWVYINAYSGKVTKEESHYMESFYVPPTEFEDFKKYFSWFLIFNYGISVYTFITRAKYKFGDFIFTISVMHFIASVVFINLISWIYLWIIMLLISMIGLLFH